MTNVEDAKRSDQHLFGGNKIESANKESTLDDEGEERVDVGDVTAEDGGIEPEGMLKLQEILNPDNGTFKEEGLENVIVVEDLDYKKKPILRSDDVESGNQKLRRNKQGQSLIDDHRTLNIVERINATIAGSGDLETRLAGDNLAGSIIAEGVTDIEDPPAVLAIGDVTPERRSNGATTACNLAFNTTFTTLKQNHLQLSGLLLMSTQSCPLPPLGTPQMVFPAEQVG